MIHLHCSSNMLQLGCPQALPVHLFLKPASLLMPQNWKCDSEGNLTLLLRP